MATYDDGCISVPVIDYLSHEYIAKILHRIEMNDNKVHDSQGILTFVSLGLENDSQSIEKIHLIDIPKAEINNIWIFCKDSEDEYIFKPDEIIEFFDEYK